MKRYHFTRFKISTEKYDGHNKTLYENWVTMKK